MHNGPHHRHTVIYVASSYNNKLKLEDHLSSFPMSLQFVKWIFYSQWHWWAQDRILTNRQRHQSIMVVMLTLQRSHVQCWYVVGICMSVGVCARTCAFSCCASPMWWCRCVVRLANWLTCLSAIWSLSKKGREEKKNSHTEFPQHHTHTHTHTGVRARA